MKELRELVSTSRNDLRIRVSSVRLFSFFSRTRSVTATVVCAAFIGSCFWIVFQKIVCNSRILDGFIEEPSRWPAILAECRNNYKQLKNMYLPKNKEVFLVDFFFSLYKAYEKMNGDELEEIQSIRDFIMTDINRTRSSDPFFQDVHVQSLMLRVLMVFAREYPKISYKQGMSDFLAIILLVLFMERNQWSSTGIFVIAFGRWWIEIPECPEDEFYSSSYLSTKAMKHLDHLLGYPRENLILRSEYQEYFSFSSLLSF